MILKRLTIKNFRSYYGESSFDFKDGLTLIIGGNGDGKTTFFDALDWLFKTGVEDKSIYNVSEMRAAQLEPGESDELRVELLFEHGGEKILEKKFRFEKDSKGNIFTRDFSFLGYEINGVEREQISGSVLLERCFDAAVRKYCLFKGETGLNIFKDDDSALKTLVDKFSDIRLFDSYVDMAQDFEEKSNKAYTKELTSDKKVAQKATDLGFKLQAATRKLIDIQQDIRQQEAMVSAYQTKVDALEHSQEVSDRYHELKVRLQAQSEKRTLALQRIDERYNYHLLDDMWILCAFPPIFKEYIKKVSALSREKRRQNEAYIEERGREKGKQEAMQELTALANGAIRLPWYVPDEGTMQEMLDQEICKVCNRPAPKGSDAYAFMQEKLEEYLRQEKEKEATEAAEEPLFKDQNIENLHSLGISLGGSQAQLIAGLGEEIRDHIEFTAARKQELASIEEKIRETEDEKQRLLIQSDGLSEDLLDKNFSDLKGTFEQKNRAEQRIMLLKQQEAELQEQKAELKAELENLNPNSSIARTYAKIHTVFTKILEAFTAAKKQNLKKFLNDLELRANEYLAKLNVDDFHGVIRIRETADESASIKLYSSNDVLISKPNGALATTMYMSVLFAISDLTTLKREVDYPLIFDAPTSSFESLKEDEFYNVIDKIKKQCIIVTKDLLEKDDVTGERRLNLEKINRLTCSVYRIEKQRPFDPEDLSTICTTAKPIK